MLSAFMAAVVLRQAVPVSKAKVEIETFACSRAWAVGTDPLTLVGTVRNSGTEAASVQQLELHALTGLEYISGDTRPKTPPLKPGERASFTWRLRPNETNGPLVAAFAVQDGSGSPSSLRVLAIQHLERTPSDVGNGGTPIPVARRVGNGAVLENDRVRLRLFESESEVGLAIFSVRTATGWKRVGATANLLELNTSEPGQSAWWESMKVEEVRTFNYLDSSVVTVSGQIGVRWRATAEFVLRKDSGAVDIKYLFAPRRSVKLEAVRGAVLLAGDGSFGANSSEKLEPTIDAQVVRSGVRYGVVVTSAAWRSPSRGSWKVEAVPQAAGADFTVLGTELQTLQPLEVATGGKLEMRARWFAQQNAVDLSAAGRLPLTETLVINAVERPTALPPPSARRTRSSHSKRGAVRGKPGKKSKSKKGAVKKKGGKSAKSKREAKRQR